LEKQLEFAKKENFMLKEENEDVRKELKKAKASKGGDNNTIQELQNKLNNIENMHRVEIGQLTQQVEQWRSTSNALEAKNKALNATKNQSLSPNFKELKIEDGTGFGFGSMIGQEEKNAHQEPPKPIDVRSTIEYTELLSKFQSLEILLSEKEKEIANLKKALIELEQKKSTEINTLKKSIVEKETDLDRLKNSKQDQTQYKEEIESLTSRISNIAKEKASLTEKLLDKEEEIIDLKNTLERIKKQKNTLDEKLEVITSSVVDQKEIETQLKKTQEKLKESQKQTEKLAEENSKLASYISEMKNSQSAKLQQSETSHPSEEKGNRFIEESFSFFKNESKQEDKENSLNSNNRDSETLKTISDEKAEIQKKDISFKESNKKQENNEIRKKEEDEEVEMLKKQLLELQTENRYLKETPPPPQPKENLPPVPQTVESYRHIQPIESYRQIQPRIIPYTPEGSNRGPIRIVSNNNPDDSSSRIASGESSDNHNYVSFGGSPVGRMRESSPIRYVTPQPYKVFVPSDPFLDQESSGQFLAERIRNVLDQYSSQKSIRKSASNSPIRSGSHSPVMLSPATSPQGSTSKQYIARPQQPIPSVEHLSSNPLSSGYSRNNPGRNGMDREDVSSPPILKKADNIIVQAKRPHVFSDLDSYTFVPNSIYNDLRKVKDREPSHILKQVSPQKELQFKDRSRPERRVECAESVSYILDNVHQPRATFKRPISPQKAPSIINSSVDYDLIPQPKVQPSMKASDLSYGTGQYSASGTHPFADSRTVSPHMTARKQKPEKRIEDPVFSISKKPPSYRSGGFKAFQA